MMMNLMRKIVMETIKRLWLIFLGLWIEWCWSQWRHAENARLMRGTLAEREQWARSEMREATARWVTYRFLNDLTKRAGANQKSEASPSSGFEELVKNPALQPLWEKCKELKPDPAQQITLFLTAVKRWGSHPLSKMVTQEAAKDAVDSWENAKREATERRQAMEMARQLHPQIGRASCRERV